MNLESEKEKMEYLYSKESYRIIGAAQEVHRELGSGFLENVYQEALEMMFKFEEIPYKREYPTPIYFKETKLECNYRSDFYCFDKIIVELKATKELTNDFFAQTMNYLKATRTELGLLINFGEKSLNVKRVIWTDKSKKK